MTEASKGNGKKIKRENNRY